MDAAAELGRNPFSLSMIGNLTRLIHTLLYVMTIHINTYMEMSRLTTRDGTAEPISRDQILRRERDREI